MTSFRGALSPLLPHYSAARRARQAPESFFRPQSNVFYGLRSPVLSCLGNSSAQQSSAQRTTVFDVLRPHAPRPKPSTRLASRPSTRILSFPWNPINLTCPFTRLLSHGGIPRPMILCPTDMTVCLASRPQRPSRASRPGSHRPARPRRPALSPMGESPALTRAAREAPVGQGGPDRDARGARHAPHGREGQRKKERVYTLPSAHVRTRMRAPARLYEKENNSKITCCRPP